MDDLLIGMPSALPPASIPRASVRLKKEFQTLGNFDENLTLTAELVDENLERLLQNRIDFGDYDAPFLLGQLQLEKRYYCSAWNNFQLAYKLHDDIRAKYQIAMMLYDNLADATEIRKFKNPKVEACNMLEEIVNLRSNNDGPLGHRDLVYSAAYNLGRAYYQGFGRTASIEKAIELFKFAAADGKPRGNVLAQTALGYIYCDPEHRDLKQAFYWHTEACGNGSVESQAAIGVMYLYGLGVKQDWASALICLSESADRGSLYGMASLAYFYYKRKMYTNAALVACKIAFAEHETECIASDCLKNFLNRAKAIGCFIYARCLQRGLGVQQDEALASELFSRSASYDSALSSRFQLLTIQEDL